MKRTGPTTKIIRRTAAELKKHSTATKKNVYRVIGQTILAATRKRVQVNLFHLNQMGEKNKDKVLVVPGIVLGTGNLSNATDIAALRFSETAAKKIVEKGGKALSLTQLMDAQSIPAQKLVLVK